MKRVIPAMLLLALAITGCSGAPKPAPGAAPCLVETLPPLPDEKGLPFTLTIGGAPLRTGQEFTLAVTGQEFTLAVTGQGADELTRGIDAYLECWTGQQWSPRFMLLSDRGADGPQAIPYQPGQAVIDIGFRADQPGRFVLPAGLAPGWYRIRLHVSGSENGVYKPYELWAAVEVKP